MALPQEFTTGSSIMPHKKNPDVFELIRAKCNRISSLHVEISGIITNLPSGYHRDYQITKEILFPAFTELSTCMSLLIVALKNSIYHDGISHDKQYELMYTVDSVNELVQQGISFREAYMIIGQKVQQGEYQKPKHFNTSHIGSINNPGLQEIQSYCKAEYSKFNFEKAETAEKQLLDNRFIQTQYLVD
jgi:argininosuccinate lyase